MARATQRPTDPEIERYLERVGKDAKRLREIRKLSQEESARQAGIPVGALRDLEQGYDARISYHILNARHLGLPFGYGLSDDISTELKRIGNMFDSLVERIDRLGECISTGPLMAHPNGRHAKEPSE